MSDLDISAGERGVIRLFALDMRPEEAKFLREPGAADQILGVTGLDPEQIDVFPVSDLEDLGLYGYLSEGCGVSEDQLDRAKLESVDGLASVDGLGSADGLEWAYARDRQIHSSNLKR